MEDYQYERITHDSKIPAFIALLNTDDIHDYFPNDIFIPAHWHRSIEISLLEDAEVILQVGENEYSVSDFTLVNSGVVHSLRVKSMGQNPRAIIVILSYDFIKKMYPNIDQTVFDIYQKSDHEELKKIFYELKELYLNQDQYSYIDINACLLKIFSCLLRDYQLPISKNRKQLSKNQNQIQEILTFIHLHYHEPLTLSDMADSFHISKEHFSRQFHHYVGKTFKEYLTSYRLYKAYEDIINSDKTVQDIARIHGFLNVKSFINSFTKVYQSTPLQYRKEILKDIKK